MFWLRAASRGVSWSPGVLGETQGAEQLGILPAQVLPPWQPANLLSSSRPMAEHHGFATSSIRLPSSTNRSCAPLQAKR